MARAHIVLVAATAASLIVGSSALAAVPPVDVSSSASPFTSCTADNVALQEQSFGSVLYSNSEVEPRSTIDPANHLNIVGEYQQDRWSDGGARGLVASVSHDGGATWKTVVVTGLTRCSGGQYDRASDPWVSFAANGDLYAIALTFDVFDSQNAIVVSKSTDGGDTWGAPTEIAADNTGGLDKESITADPTNPNVVYAAWDRIIYPGGSTHASDQGTLRSRSYKSQTFFSKTVDGGQTWSPPRQIFTTSSYAGSIGSIVRVLSDGTLLDALQTYGTSWKGGQCGSVSVLRSTDGGATWTQKPAIVAPFSCTYLGAHDPDTGALVRSGGLPDIAVSGTTAYLVWEDALSAAPTTGRIFFSQSSDGGVTWSAPVVVSKTPPGLDAFLPTVAVNSAGTVGVTYYDFRNYVSGSGIGTTDYWLERCAGTCTGASSWTETRITPTSFDIHFAPVARGLFLGDYEGLTTDGTTFQPFFIEAVGASNPTDAFFASAP